MLFCDGLRGDCSKHFFDRGAIGGAVEYGAFGKARGRPPALARALVVVEKPARLKFADCFVTLDDSLGDRVKL